MQDKIFWRIFFVLAAVAMLLTIAHFIYILYAYNHSSIIYFIGKELW